MLLGTLGGTASADAPAECRAVNDKAVTTTDLGCFDGLKWEDDYVYGTRVCLVRTDTDLCAGVAALFGGPPELDAQRLDRVSCGGNGNSVTFSGVWGACDMAGNCHATPIACRWRFGPDAVCSGAQDYIGRLRFAYRALTVFRRILP